MLNLNNIWWLYVELMECSGGWLVVEIVFVIFVVWWISNGLVNGISGGYVVVVFIL